MAANLKNYTSEVPAITSMGRIEKNLVEAGATDISKKYEGGICVAISFRLVIRSGHKDLAMPMFFQLPAKVDACFNVLWKEVKKPLAGTKERTLQQAERTAWKIISDWVEVQLAMIKLEQAEVLQIFLPYVYDAASDQTFYQKVKEGGMKLLTN